MTDDVDSMHESRKALQNNVSIIVTATFRFFTTTHHHSRYDGVEKALC